MQKFLIIQTAFIGDVILATPVIEKLHAHYPDARIDFFLRKGNEGLFRNHPNLFRVYVWDKKKGKYANLISNIRKIRQENYDYAINLHRFTSSGIITLFSKAKNKIGFAKNPLAFLYTKRYPHIISKGVHEVDRNLSLISALTDETRTGPKLYPTGEDYGNTQVYKSDKYICIAPTSVWYSKQFPAEKWMDLIKELNPEYKIYLLGSKADFDFCENIRQSLPKRRIINLCGRLNLLESAALIKDSVMNYVNDSAPLHLASSLSAKVTAVFCSTVTDFGFGPYGKNGRVVEIDYPLECRPCGLHGFSKCPKGHFKCALEIKTEQLLFE